MVPISTTVACVLTLFITLILPVLILISFAARHKGQGILSAWFFGALGFFVPQMLIRIPILNYLSTSEWMLSLLSNPFLYSLFLAFTAALFELTGRIAATKLLGKRLTYKRAFAAGLGHGGIEAILITGTAYITNLVNISLINAGNFLDSSVELMPVPTIEERIMNSLINTPYYMFLLAGVERILVMTAHLAMSIIICRGVYSGKLLQASVICLVLHTLIDMTAGVALLIGSSLTALQAYLIIYGFLTLVAVFSVIAVYKISRVWKPCEESLQ